MTAIQPSLPLTLPATSTFADWSHLGTILLTARRKVNWLIGDWLDRGLTDYGDKARDEANRIYRSDVDRFAPILETCRRFPEEQRHDLLTFEHHVAVRDIEDDAQAQTMLDKAEADRMTVAALKAEVKVSSNRQTTILPDDDPDDTAYRRIVQAWNLASRASREAFLESAQESNMGVIDL